MVNKDTQSKPQTRAKVGVISTDENGKKPTITLNEAKKKARSSASRSTKSDDVMVKDIYQNVSPTLYA